MTGARRASRCLRCGSRRQTSRERRAGSGLCASRGTPVFGGLTSGQVAIILRDIAGIDIVGSDVVEASSSFDPSGKTAAAGSRIMLELLCLMANKQGKAEGDHRACGSPG